MFKSIFALFNRKPQYVWQNKDHDIPVEYIGPAGVMNGIIYAEVKYEGKVSYVPLEELVHV